MLCYFHFEDQLLDYFSSFHSLQGLIFLGTIMLKIVIIDIYFIYWGEQ